MSKLNEQLKINVYDYIKAGAVNQSMNRFNKNTNIGSKLSSSIILRKSEPFYDVCTCVFRIVQRW